MEIEGNCGSLSNAHRRFWRSQFMCEFEKIRGTRMETDSIFVPLLFDNNVSKSVLNNEKRTFRKTACAKSARSLPAGCFSRFVYARLAPRASASLSCHSPANCEFINFKFEIISSYERNTFQRLKETALGLRSMVLTAGRAFPAELLNRVFG